MGKSNLNFSEEIGGRDFARKTGMKAALLEGGSPACFRPTETTWGTLCGALSANQKSKTTRDITVLILD